MSVCLWDIGEKETETWNLTPLSHLPGPEESECVVVSLNLPFCLSTHTKLELEPHISALFTLTVCDKRHIEHTLKCQASCHRRHKHITSVHMSYHGTRVCCRGTPLEGFAATWQFSIVPSLLCHCHSSCHHGDELSFPASHAVVHTLQQRQTLSHLSIRLSSKHTKSRKALLLLEST